VNFYPLGLSGSDGCGYAAVAGKRKRFRQHALAHTPIRHLTGCYVKITALEADRMEKNTNDKKI